MVCMKMNNILKNIISKMMINTTSEVLESQAETFIDEQPLPTENIAFSFEKIGYIQSDDFISQVSDELKVPLDTVRLDLERIVKGMRKDITCCIEYPYIDTYYRDTYYSFYSKKHCSYSRYCFRISFFSNEVTEDNFYDIDLSEKFYGYMVLRPTMQRVIGYTFLSPKLFIQHNFVCCLCKKKVSIYGKKLIVVGFPFCGQDGEAVSCAETSLIMMMDYFSHKYNKYSQLLPSQILKILSRYSNERQLPTRGLPSEMLSYTLRKLGFGIRTYTRQYEDADCDVYSDEEFKRLLYIYIESGFPIAVCTDNHTYLIIGKECKLGEADIKLVTINDNDRPYSLVEFNHDITSFIVPLYEKIYLDAEMIKIDPVIESLESEFSDLKVKQDGMKYIYRYFLTTSRSYKDYIISSNLKDSREHFVCMAMPHFIWVCEMIDVNQIMDGNLGRSPVSNVLLFNATEGNTSLNYFIMAKLSDKIIVRTTDNSQYHRKIYKRFDGNKDIFYTFDRNLKGEHSKWQD